MHCVDLIIRVLLTRNISDSSERVSVYIYRLVLITFCYPKISPYAWYITYHITINTLYQTWPFFTAHRLCYNFILSTVTTLCKIWPFLLNYEELIKMSQVETRRQDYFDFSFKAGSSMKSIVLRVTFLYIVYKLFESRLIIDGSGHIQDILIVSWSVVEMQIASFMVA